MLNFDIPPNTVYFKNHWGETYLKVDYNGFQFIPPHQTTTKDEMAKWLVGHLQWLWDNQQPTNKITVQLDVKTVVLVVTESDLIYDEPTKPTDFWTLNLAKKLWKERKRQAA